MAKSSKSNATTAKRAQSTQRRTQKTVAKPAAKSVRRSVPAVEDAREVRAVTFLEALNERANQADNALHDNIRTLREVLSPVLRSDFEFEANPVGDRDPEMSLHEHHVLNSIEQVEQAADYILQLARSLRL